MVSMACGIKRGIRFSYLYLRVLSVANYSLKPPRPVSQEGGSRTRPYNPLRDTLASILHIPIYAAVGGGQLAGKGFHDETRAFLQSCFPPLLLC